MGVQNKLEVNKVCRIQNLTILNCRIDFNRTSLLLVIADLNQLFRYAYLLVIEIDKSLF